MSDSIDNLPKCDRSLEQYFTVVLFVFQFYPVCNFGLDAVRSERVNIFITSILKSQVIPAI